MTFEEIRRRAVSEWEAFEHSKKPRIFVGTATCGRAAGALAVLEAIDKELEARNIDAMVTQVGCIGLCYAEPLVDIIKPGRPRICYGNVTPEIIPSLIEDYLIKDNPRPDLALGAIGEEGIEGIPKLFELPVLKPQVRIILRRCGFIDPGNINHYIANGGYSGLARVLRTKPEEIIEEIRRSGLRGRGGAGFPTGRKWQYCRDAPGSPKYVICNGDEGDPGAYMDRTVLEGDPHSVLEGMAIGAYAIGASEGYVYVRDEYPLAVKSMRWAIFQAEEYGLLGKNILGSGFDFTVHIVRGAGAFVCGEETALMASIEGKIGEPRPRPPFPATSGLWGKPTNINNVKTWASVPPIITRGAEWYAQMGTPKSKGTVVFSLVGRVNNTGLVEVPVGVSLREIIYDIGGGIRSGKSIKAVQTGGPSGGVIPVSLLNLPVDYETLEHAGSIMGSGGMVVMDEDSCMVDVACYFLSFTMDESCGKCTPCREGIREMHRILTGITEGKGKEGDIERLEELAHVVKESSLCALGRTAPNPVLTTIRYFRDEYEAHIKEGRCPAGMCKSLVSYYIDPDKCQACMICLRNCPAGAINGDRGVVHIIDQEKCTKCGTCLEVCPPRFGAVKKISARDLPEAVSRGTPVKRRGRGKNG